ncbi:hypothetical protein CE91St45_03370 [Oscillospiraceae bacterium]|nr:hypothetical protein CE91St45_03370 [Oscillospiraceae bacterium]
MGWLIYTILVYYSAFWEIWQAPPIAIVNAARPNIPRPGPARQKAAACPGLRGEKAGVQKTNAVWTPVRVSDAQTRRPGRRAGTAGSFSPRGAVYSAKNAMGSGGQLCTIS